MKHNMVLYFCVDFRELSHLTHELSQAEKKINIVAQNDIISLKMSKKLCRLFAFRILPFFEILKIQNVNLFAERLHDYNKC